MAKEFYVSIISSGPMFSALMDKCLASEFGVVAWSPAKPDLAPYASTRAYLKDTAAEAVLVGDVVLAWLGGQRATHDVLFSQGVAAALKPGCVFVDISLTDAETSKMHAGRLESRGFKYLFAPFPGGAALVSQGTAKFAASGSEAAYKQAAAVLSLIGAPQHQAA